MKSFTAKQRWGLLKDTVDEVANSLLSDEDVRAFVVLKKTVNHNLQRKKRNKKLHSLSTLFSINFSNKKITAL